MAERLKDLFFTAASIEKLSETVQSAYPSFNKKAFLDCICDDTWPDKALKEKMHHTAECLWEVINLPFPETMEILKQVAPAIQGFEALTFPDVVEQYGQDHWELSMDLLGFFTRFGSAEFAVRPFLKADLAQGLSYLHRWAEDPLPEVRRLASEGSRPRLPWGMALPELKEDPKPVIPVLEKLKDDPSETVRRSVANHMNDISKDNPEIALEICERWFGRSPEVDWVVRHACRGMLKKGNPRALALFGFGDAALLAVSGLALDDPNVAIGGELKFSFALSVAGDETILVRVEYAIDFVKARGSRSRKVFHLSEKHYQPGTHQLTRAHSFRDRSTRKHYPGEHLLTIVVNGEAKGSIIFHVD